MSSRLLNRWVFRTSAMRPLNRSTMPLVLGVLGLVSRCSMPSSWHSWSNSWWPLGSRSRLANSRSVNSLPLSVNSLLILIGHQGAIDAMWEICKRERQELFLQQLADLSDDGSLEGQAAPALFQLYHRNPTIWT